LFFNPGLRFRRVEGEGLEGHKVQRTAHAGSKPITPVEGDALVPVIKTPGFGAGDEEFGDGMGAGDGKL
jgi:hypothetical protein